SAPTSRWWAYPTPAAGCGPPDRSARGSPRPDRTPRPSTGPRCGTGRSGGCSSLFEPVTASGDGRDRRRLPQLLAEVAHRHPDDVGHGVDHLVPDVLEEMLLAEDLPRVEHEVVEQGELLGGEVERHAVT